jgi:AcrR family transcriptional regulator
MPRTTTRRAAVADLKRTLILDAAWEVFSHDGLEGASMRAIARAAGYTAGAIYFHFDSKEAIYAALLDRSLDALGARTRAAADAQVDDAKAVRAAAEAYFDFYADNSRDLDLGFYLFRGGMQPHGLGRDRDRGLNDSLLAALEPLRAAMQRLGVEPQRADAETAAFFAHASGLLLLLHTGRIKLFQSSPRELIVTYLDDLAVRILEGPGS